MKECKNCNRNNCCALALTCIPYGYKYWEEVPNLVKSILGVSISLDVKGIVYLCVFNESDLTITVVKELFFYTAFQALDAYANIPNPESQLVTGKTYEELCTNLETLHKNMKDKEWLKNLAETL